MVYLDLNLTFSVLLVNSWLLFLTQENFYKYSLPLIKSRIIGKNCKILKCAKISFTDCKVKLPPLILENDVLLLHRDREITFYVTCCNFYLNYLTYFFCILDELCPRKWQKTKSRLTYGTPCMFKNVPLAEIQYCTIIIPAYFESVALIRSRSLKWVLKGMKPFPYVIGCDVIKLFLYLLMWFSLVITDK